MDSSSQFGSYSSPQSSKHGSVNRFDYGRPSLQSRSSLLQAKIINVYTNGSKYRNDRKFQVLVSHKLTPSMKKLYEAIDDKKKSINNSEVHCLYTWPDGKLVDSIADVEEYPKSTLYICSDNRTPLYTIGNYDNIPYTGSSTSGSAFTGKLGGQSNTLNVTSAHTGEAVSIFLYKKSQQPYEELLENIRGMFGDKHPKIVTLYTMSKHPKKEKKINSVSAIKRALAEDKYYFWACGVGEDPPDTRMSRNASPKRSGYKDKQKNGDRYKQNGYHDVRDSQSNGKQSNGYTDNQGRSYQRYQTEEYEDDDLNHEEESDQEPSSPLSRGYGHTRDQSPRRDNKKVTNQRKPREQDESPHGKYRRAQRRDDDDDEEEEDRKYKKGRHDADKHKSSKREQTPPRKERKNSHRSDDNSCEEDEYDIDKSDHPSEEEMRERIEELSEIDRDQDKKIKY